MTSFITLHKQLVFTSNQYSQNLGKKIRISVEQIVYFTSNGERIDDDFKTKYEKELPSHALKNQGTKIELTTGSTINVCECEEYIETALSNLGYSIE